MKLGIVGTGKIVHEFLPYLTQIPGIECCAICGTKRSETIVKDLAAKYEISYWYTDFSEFIKEDIDTVYIASPNNTHFIMARQAIENCKNVIIEKPVTTDGVRTRLLYEMAEQQKVFIYEAITTIHNRNYLKIMELLDRIGDVKMVSCNFSQHSSRYDSFTKGIISPVFDPEKAGGALMDINIYNAFYVCGLFGKPLSATYLPVMENNIDTSGVLTLKYEGFAAACIGSKNSDAPPSCIIQGTKGYIVQETTPNICGRVSLHLNDGTGEYFEPELNRHRMISEFENFVRQINLGDLAGCYKLFALSILVSELINQVRIEAGIVFPDDK